MKTCPRCGLPANVLPSYSNFSRLQCIDPSCQADSFFPEECEDDDDEEE
jgi:hypothetical protein